MAKEKKKISAIKLLSYIILLVIIGYMLLGVVFKNVNKNSIEYIGVLKGISNTEVNTNSILRK